MFIIDLVGKYVYVVNVNDNIVIMFVIDVEIGLFMVVGLVMFIGI